MAEELKVPHIATGDLFRAEMARDSALGQLARQYISAGNLVPDDVVNDMVKERIGRDDCMGFVMDGYPRTLQQAAAMEETLGQAGRPLSVAVQLEVPDEVIVERAVGRVVCPNCEAIYHLDNKPPRRMGICDVCRHALVVRDDDQPSTVRHRLAVYRRLTRPVLEFYRERDLLRDVDGVGPREEITSRIRAHLPDVCYN